MLFINYFFASIISYSGLLIGIFLVQIAPEEQMPLKKYFVSLSRFLLFMIFIFMFLYYYNKFLYSIILLLLLAFLLFSEFHTRYIFRKVMFIYFILGIIFLLSPKNFNLFVIESSLILLYGIPTSSSIYNKKGKNFLRIFYYSFIFIIIANFLFYL